MCMRALPTRWVRSVLALAPAVVLSMACGGGATPATAAPPVPNPVLLKLYETTTVPGVQLPPIVAQLGSTQLLAPQFAERVAEIEYNDARTSTTESRAQVWQTALDGWLREAALHERAMAEGISVSDVEVDRYIAQQSKLRDADLAANPQAAADYQAFIEARGYTRPDDYDHDPRAIQTVRWLLETARLTAKDLPAGATQADHDAFVAGTIALERTKLKLFIKLG
jgi:hypothetical protein